MLDEVTEILRCPVTGSRLRREGDELVSAVGGLRYPIRDGVAQLLPAAAVLPEGFDSMDAFRRRYCAGAGREG